MKQPSDYSDRIVIENGKITRILTASYCDKKHGGSMYYCDVYKEDEDGNRWEQNCYCSMWGGYVVAFPGLPINDKKGSWYYDPTIAEEEGWHTRETKAFTYYSDHTSRADEELVCSYYPDFRYVLKKYKVESKQELMAKLCMWKAHPELELILAAGYEKIGMNKTFWRMTEKNRKEICQFMRKFPDYTNLSLQEIRHAIKSGKPEVYAEYLSTVPGWDRPDRISSRYASPHPESKVSFEDFLYLKKQTHIKKDTFGTEMCRRVSIFGDVLRMIEQTNHDIRDDYWRHPNDLIVMHERLQNELAVIREAERMAKEKADAEKAKKREKTLKKLEKLFAGFNGNFEGYSIFVTSDYDEWKKQAEALHQCICAAGYYQKVADGKCVLVFIQKDGQPVATAEIFENKKIGQFYANERNRSNCLPSEEVRNVFTRWLESVPEKNFKKRTPRKSTKKSEVAA